MQAKELLQKLQQVPADAATLQRWYEEHKTELPLAVFAAWNEELMRMMTRGDATTLDLAQRVVQLVALAEDLEIIAMAHRALGNVYVFSDQPREALANFTRAENIYQQLDQDIALAQMGIGKVWALDQLGQHEQAIEFAQSLKPLLEAPGQGEYLSRLYGCWGIAYEHLGRYYEALSCYEFRYNWCQQGRGAQARIGVARAQVNIAIVKTLLGLYAEAEDDFAAARKILVEHEVNADVARVDMSIAWLLAREGREADTVRAAFARARHSRQQTSPTGLSLLDIFEAEWALQQERRCSADLAHRLEQAHTECAALGLAYEATYAELLLAHCARYQADYTQAHTRFQHTKQQAQTQGNPELYYLACFGQGQTWEAQEAADQAAQAYREAITELESIRRNMPTDKLRAGYLQDKLAVYRALTRLYLRQGAYEQAWHMVERARARALVEMLQTKVAKLEVAPPTAEEQPAVAQLRERLQAVQQELNERTQEHRRAAEQEAQERELEVTLGTLATPELRDLEHKIAQINQQLQYHAPRYSHLLTVQITPMTELCAHLPPDTLMLSYAVLADSTWVFPLTHAGLLEPQKISYVPKSSEVRQCGEFLQRAHAGSIPAAQQELSQWWQRLIAPVQEHLKTYAKLIIVPDGVLHHLPFHAFFDPTAQRYLIETHTVSYAPSATAWLFFLQNHSHPHNDALVIGFSAGGSLPHVRHEAWQVAEAMSNLNLCTEEQAHSHRLGDTLAQNADVIHLATHGFLRCDSPILSGLLLTDGLLHAYEIYNLRLNASLVVLSACETAQGVLRGNELLGLTRGFQYAGARAVIASLWPVHDQVTALLMKALYQHLQLGLSTAAALRQAQLEVLHHAQEGSSPYAHPYYWAPFVLNGADGTVGAIGVANWLIRQAKRWVQKLHTHLQRTPEALEQPEIAATLQNLSAIWKMAETGPQQCAATQETLHTIKQLAPELWDQLQTELTTSPGWTETSISIWHPTPEVAYLERSLKQPEGKSFAPVRQPNQQGIIVQLSKNDTVHIQSQLQDITTAYSHRRERPQSKSTKEDLV